MAGGQYAESGYSVREPFHPSFGPNVTPTFVFTCVLARTTEVPPAEPLPQNAGVIISAMDLPLRPDFAGKRPAENFPEK